MAYSLYRSAAASPGAFGQGLAALQSAINFRDVKSDAGVKALQEVAINDFIAKSNMAKQALGELGAFNRDQLMVDYYKDRDEQFINQKNKTNKMEALLGLLRGGGTPAFPANQLGGFIDPYAEMQRQRNYRNNARIEQRNRMGGLHPDAALKDAMSMLDIPVPQSVGVTLPAQRGVTSKPSKVEGAKSTANNQYYKFLTSTKQ